MSAAGVSLGRQSGQGEGQRKDQAVRFIEAVSQVGGPAGLLAAAQFLIQIAAGVLGDEHRRRLSEVVHDG